MVIVLLVFFIFCFCCCWFLVDDFCWWFGLGIGCGGVVGCSGVIDGCIEGVDDYGVVCVGGSLW